MSERGYGVAMHAVVGLALDGVLAFDLSTPVEVFGRARLPDGRAPYRVRVCAPAEEVDAGAFSVRVRWGLGTLAEADTIVQPALPRADRHDPPAVAAPVPHPPGAVSPRDHRAPRRADRRPGRVRLPDDLS